MVAECLAAASFDAETAVVPVYGVEACREDKDVDVVVLSCGLDARRCDGCDGCFGEGDNLHVGTVELFVVSAVTERAARKQLCGHEFTCFLGVFDNESDLLLDEVAGCDVCVFVGRYVVERAEHEAEATTFLPRLFEDFVAFGLGDAEGGGVAFFKAECELGFVEGFAPDFRVGGVDFVTVFSGDGAVATGDAVLGVPLEGGEVADFGTYGGDYLDACGAVAYDADAFVFECYVGWPGAGVVHLAFEGVDAGDFGEVAFREEAERGDEVSGSESVAA